MDGHNVRMRQRAGRASFLREAVPEVVSCNALMEQFDGNEAIDERIVREIDRSHTTLPDVVADFVAGDELRRVSHSRVSDPLTESTPQQPANLVDTTAAQM